MTTQRLQKILASAGVSSRRAAEDLITAGRVRVNGKVVRELGAKADSRADKITVDGKTLVRERHVYYLLHKPRGYVTTVHDPEGRPTVMDILKGVPERIFPVGRLDWNTAGALLLTNDGDLAQALMHPKKKVVKTYAAKIQGFPSEQTLERWRKGIELEDGKTLPADIWILSEGANATWLRVEIREGRNRQIHRMGEATGHPVLRLTRTEFAGLGVDDLRPGEYRPLNPTEVDDLRQEFLLGIAPARPRPQSRGAGNERKEPRRDERPTRYEGRGPRPPRPPRPAEAVGDRGPRADERPTRAFTRPRDPETPRPAPRGPRTDDRLTRVERGPRPARGPSRPEGRDARPERPERRPARPEGRPARPEGRPEARPARRPADRAAPPAPGPRARPADKRRRPRD